MTSPYAPLVMWALGVRDSGHTSPASVALNRAVTPELATRALTVPSLRARLVGVPAERQSDAVLALGVLSRQRHLRHDPRVRLGNALRHLSDSAIGTLAIATASTQPNACRLIGNALAQAGRHTPAHLVEFVTLLTDWDHLDIRSRSEFLVDLHSVRRA